MSELAISIIIGLSGVLICVFIISLLMFGLYKIEREYSATVQNLYSSLVDDRIKELENVKLNIKENLLTLRKDKNV